jgi:hypothetical protein
MNPSQRQASDTSGSFDIDEILGVFANWEEIMRCARHHNATVKEKLYALACPHLADREQLVSWLLGSEETHPEVISAIANDPAPEIRALIAAYQHAPAGILAGFAHDPAESVRIHLAGNPSTTPATLTALAHDSAVPVVLAAAAAEALDFLERDRLAGHPLGSVRAVIARRPDLPAGIAERFAKDRTEEVVEALVQAAACHTETLASITTIRDATLREKLLRHPAAGSRMIAGFFADPLRDIRDLARQRNLAFSHAPHKLHPSNSAPARTGTPRSHEENNRRAPLNPSAIYWYLDADFSSPSVFAAAVNPEMPKLLRLAVLARSDVPTAIREACVTDPDSEIRSAALALDHRTTTSR